MGRRGSSVAVALVLVLSGWLAQAPATRAADVCFQETGHCIQGRFLAYWQEHGGLAINGFPLSDERQELLEDGNTYTVQYFERVRLEYHPENQPPYDVLLGQFGRRVVRESFGLNAASYQAAVAPAQPLAGQAYFQETGHNLGGGFLDYWQTNGGLAQFGFPLTEEFEAPLGGSTNYRVQYFERARFEYHPENQPPYDVLLGQFGRQILTENARLSDGFGVLYITNERVREVLGPPSSTPPTVTAGAAQEFEHGRLIYWHNPATGAGLIAALCGDSQSGQVFVGSRLQLFFEDTWDASQPVGGGPGPQPGLYQPMRGFGKLWREHADIRQCLGYATMPDETAGTITEQAFAFGLLLSTPDGQEAYALYFTGEVGPNNRLVARYERFTLPIR
ncbi:MAG: hypothetical protein ACTHMR_05335 [Thermomicrobiales bacterium]